MLLLFVFQESQSNRNFSLDTHCTVSNEGYKKTASNKNQHTREIISALNTSHKYSNKDLSRQMVTLTWHACKY